MNDIQITMAVVLLICGTIIAITIFVSRPYSIKIIGEQVLDDKTTLFDCIVKKWPKSYSKNMICTFANSNIDAIFDYPEISISKLSKPFLIAHSKFERQRKKKNKENALKKRLSTQNYRKNA